MEIPQALH